MTKQQPVNVGPVYRAGWEAGFSYRENGCSGPRPSRLTYGYKYGTLEATSFELGVCHGMSAAVEFYGKSANIKVLMP